MATWQARPIGDRHSESPTQRTARGRPIGLGFYVSHGKRAFDIIVGGLLLAMSLPPMALVAGLVYVTSGRPVIFKQTRVGLGGVPFNIYKFRTMAPDRRVDDLSFDGEDRRKVHKSLGDPRVNRFGALLRALSLDELPQFLNVVRGQMSLVGPRPELPEIVAQYEDWQHERHLVQPGLTGTWQISARQRLLRECTDMDIDYIRNISFSRDLKILLSTPWALITRKGH